MLFAILLTIQILVSVSMAGLILIQRSEGGALGMGGGGGGFMSARGTGNLLTRATAILGFVFFANSIGLTIVGNYSQRVTSAVDKVDTSGLMVNTSAQPTAPAAQTSTSAAPSLSDLPLAGATPASSAVAPVAPVVNAKPAVLPAPLKLPASSSAASVSEKRIEQAKEGIWASSSSAAPKSAAAVKSSATPSSATPSSAATSSASK
ncbi:preprotein translocase subunit SecG [Asticcacaulis sp.]|uniref:preprotein translocase subunit SecG n=1 Tax=Asticcacaulis sp. TaxID=1872648 RepID=UPI002C7B18E7|nr:preprotein translocase subunit SecG [Asticcacaulis sp.]HTM82408.1 preprotein translocase subunit SecG [Asticcacaulis sp.]